MNNKLPNGKLILGALVMPLLAFICAGMHDEQLCTGVFVVLTLVTWVVLYFRVAAMVHSIRAVFPRRQRYTPLDQQQQRPSAAPLSPPVTDGDSRSIFL